MSTQEPFPEPEGDLFIKEILDAEIGEVSFVDMPATDRPFVLFKRKEGDDVAQNKGAELDSCVEQVMAEGKDKDSAYAICTASVEGKGDGEDGEKAGPPPPPPRPPQQQAPPQAETVQVPEAPTAVAVNDVMTKCLEMGLNEEQANQVVQLIRTNYGDPNQPDSILLPAGVTVEQMIQAAIQVVQGGQQPQQPAPPQAGGQQAPAPPQRVPPKGLLRFTGQNYWAGLFYKFIGRAAPGEEVTDVRIEDIAAAFEKAQAKSNEQTAALLDRVLKESDRRNDQMMRLFAGAIGVEMPKEEKEEEEVDQPNVVQAPTPGQAVGNPPVPVKGLKADDIEKLIEWARANGWKPEGEENEEAETAPVAAPEKRVLARKSVDPGRSRESGMVRSTYLGIDIPRADRAALRGR